MDVIAAGVATIRQLVHISDSLLMLWLLSFTESIIYIAILRNASFIVYDINCCY